MRTGYVVLLIVTILFGSWFWSGKLKNPCDIPIYYTIGEIDEQFGVGRDDVRLAALTAEELWEGPTGQVLFTYSEEKGIPIHLIFDERQLRANEESELRGVLISAKDISNEFREEYDALKVKYDGLVGTYETRSVVYERSLTGFNARVAEHNRSGGAPQGMYETLQEEQKKLEEERRALNTMARDLNALVREMNSLAAKGNSIIRDYNEVAEEYNDRFSEPHEFTQGDYKMKSVSIYQFDTKEELALVIAHEFGHALSLPHVEGETSIMYAKMGEQSLTAGISSEDRALFHSQCDPRTAKSLFGL